MHLEVWRRRQGPVEHSGGEACGGCQSPGQSARRQRRNLDRPGLTRQLKTNRAATVRERENTRFSDEASLRASSPLIVVSSCFAVVSASRCRVEVPCTLISALRCHAPSARAPLGVASATGPGRTLRRRGVRGMSIPRSKRATPAPQPGPTGPHPPTKNQPCRDRQGA
jgi:hypothetical protein